MAIEYKFLENGYKFSEGEILALNTLMHVLSSSYVDKNNRTFEAVANNSRLLVAKETDLIAGTGCLVPMFKPTGREGSIQDVVVLPEYRGKHIGENICLELIGEAKRLGIERVTLTSKPTRVEANQLYQKLGFELKETNFYVLNLWS